MHKSSVSIYFFLRCKRRRRKSHLAFESRAFHAVLSYAITSAAFSLRCSCVHVAETIEGPCRWCSCISPRNPYPRDIICCLQSARRTFRQQILKTQRLPPEDEILLQKFNIPCFPHLAFISSRLIHNNVMQERNLNEMCLQRRLYILLSSSAAVSYLSSPWELNWDLSLNCVWLKARLSWNLFQKRDFRQKRDLRCSVYEGCGLNIK